MITIHLIIYATQFINQKIEILLMYLTTHTRPVTRGVVKADGLIIKETQKSEIVTSLLEATVG